jgi:pimeloyl-ACP methyl ester carboxylesterase
MRSTIARKFAILSLAALALSPLCRAQSQIAGDWQGKLNAGGAEFRVAWHVTLAKDGSLTSTLDNIDQGIFAIPVKSTILNGSHVTLTVDADITNNGETIHVRGAFDGAIDKDATELKGTWTQSEPEQQPADLSLKHLPAQAAAKLAVPSDIDGAWLGTLDTGTAKLRLVLKIANGPDGLTASLQSPDQSPQWLPASSVTRSDSSLTVEFKPIGAVYTAKIGADLNSIDGTFTQGGVPLPLVLKRMKDQAELETRHPQNPVNPYPYREEDVTYANKAAGNTLAGTLTIPPGKGPFPAVLLISGSGPNDRDESAFGHKPFLILADYLTRKGVAVLRADKRGIGKSTGDLANATTADFASDAEAGVQYLKTRAEVDPHRIGLIGHSEGGTIAPMVAASDPGVRFIVLMAGPGVPGDQSIVEQVRLIQEAAGATKEKAAQDADKQREIFALVEKEKDDTVLDKELRATLSGQMPEAQMDVAIQQLTSPWMRYTLTYDPAIALRKVACPVLALNGEKDVQVSSAQNLPAIKKALEEGGNKHAEIDELPGLNHLFQTAKTGSPTEYAQSEETIAPVALDKIAGWILKQ